jgi:hypothetical protein
MSPSLKRFFSETVCCNKLSYNFLGIFFLSINHFANSAGDFFSFEENICYLRLCIFILIEIYKEGFVFIRDLKQNRNFFFRNIIFCCLAFITKEGGMKIRMYTIRCIVASMRIKSFESSRNLESI